MTPTQCLDYLFNLQNSGIKLGLENTTRLLEGLGDPQHKIPAIHIAGTKGKGSTAAFVESILRAAGYRTGLYTSPHIRHFSERIQVNREPIPENAMVNGILHIKETAERIGVPVTFFEFGTALAFQYFVEQKVDWNVIEVGMGGRLDSTNTCQGEVCIVTSISRDHESSLGSELPGIAFEKASIIKDTCTVVTGVDQPEVFLVIEDRAREFDCRLLQLDRDFKVNLRTHQPGKMVFDFESPTGSIQGLTSPLLGRYQAHNAAMAIAACQALDSKGVKLTPEIIRRGIATAQWAGRLEVVNESPLTLLDCAHNLDSLQKLMEAMKELYPSRKLRIVLGIMQDKPYRECIEIIARFAHHITLTRPRQDRSLNPADLAGETFSIGPLEIIEDVPQALIANQKQCGPDELICVTGSIFTVAEAREYIERTCLK
ncbi:Folylpolyglutamate synthase [Nitrospina gracilis 3/211]|uniref:Dihydrofolate synthase/folylpolyglutamate synthase n=1 Tax=Nitrospina gracilis (strain 3/211) TaxID=1266370 RepID=M1YZT5_NITG3|nr:MULTISPECIES: folylpolyglutamate synthase/dihydrofolate synthase family protein [Nitrospina]MCF8724086.1 dihydrofolate synthase/folylpolyglutamate synthase [Nitrospina sp. Nb-3]CCQ91227.1 Folylpolyglutamate synthase [Nitrospina gracilis 3/211]